jgi:hypothetical protein
MAHLKILPLGVVFASGAVPSARWLYLSPSARCVRRMEVDGETGMASCLKLAGRRRGRPGPARVRRAGNEDVSSNFVRHARAGLHLSHGARACRKRSVAKILLEETLVRAHMVGVLSAVRAYPTRFSYGRVPGFPISYGIFVEKSSFLSILLTHLLSPLS